MKKRNAAIDPHGWLGNNVGADCLWQVLLELVIGCFIDGSVQGIPDNEWFMHTYIIQFFTHAETSHHMQRLRILTLKSVSASAMV